MGGQGGAALGPGSKDALLGRRHLRPGFGRKNPGLAAWLGRDHPGSEVCAETRPSAGGVQLSVQTLSLSPVSFSQSSLESFLPAQATCGRFLWEPGSWPLGGRCSACPLSSSRAFTSTVAAVRAQAARRSLKFAILPATASWVRLCHFYRRGDQGSRHEGFRPKSYSSGGRAGTRTQVCLPWRPVLFLPHLPFVSFSRFSGFRVLQSRPRACSKCWFPWTHHRSPPESELGGGPRNLHSEDTPQAVVRLGVCRLCRPTLTRATVGAGPHQLPPEGSPLVWRRGWAPSGPGFQCVCASG